ncbi:MAG: hypothetical protein PHI12_07630 [Dehalococcoidales bacterium]|nr:hypothetical protein [Dehalococcoidales bacterium]
MKRTIQRPWGKKKDGGWVFLNESLIKALKMGDAVEFGDITVGSKQLRQLIELMPQPDTLIRSNGHLEVEAILRINRKGPDGEIKGYFQKPKHNTASMVIKNKAWIPKETKVTVVLKPKRY